MAEWVHHTPYRFYVQRYPDANSQGGYPIIDLEEHFKCRYVSFKGLTRPAPKTVYTEDYPEMDGLRVWTDYNVKCKSSEVTLTLRWRSEECGYVQPAMKFIETYIMGRKFEYHDTFRPGYYWQLICNSAPEITQERLYGNQQYIFAQFKFTNFGGTPTTYSKLS